MSIKTAQPENKLKSKAEKEIRKWEKQKKGADKKIMMEQLKEELRQSNLENETLRNKIALLEKELSNSRKIFKIVVGALLVIILLVGLKSCDSWTPNPYGKGATAPNVTSTSIVIDYKD